MSLVASLVAQAARLSHRAWFECWCWLKIKGEAFQEGAPAHEYQAKIDEVIDWCLEHGVPARLVCLKPRRGGSSTYCVSRLHHFLTWLAERAGCIMGGSDFQGNNLFSMLRLMAHRDTTVKARAKVLDTEARYSNGSTAIRINASNKNAGLSGGYDFLIVTELAKWAQDGVAAAAEVLAGALKCVPYKPGTVIIVESTAEGVGNEFHRIYSTGITLEELKAGKTGFVKVFSPWYEFKDLVHDESLGLAPQTPQDMTPTEEADLIAKYSLSPGQVGFMRRMIKEECRGSFDNFKENYPFNDVDCFLTSGRGIFSSRGLEKLKVDALKFPGVVGPDGQKHVGETGSLNYMKGTEEADIPVVIWQPEAPKDCRVLRLEAPMEGMKYLVYFDNMEGASVTMGADPDNHGVGVWRAGYFDPQGKWCPPRVVAMLVDLYEEWLAKRRFQCIWDNDIVVEQVRRLALYYGNCLIVPEMNKDRGGAMWLHNKGMNVFKRPAWNQREQHETNVIGWLTTENTKGMMISALQKGVREYANVDPVTGPHPDRCEVFFPIILDEMTTFVQHTSGKMGASEGKHDDSVTGCSMGLCCIDGATTYRRRGGLIPGDPFDRGQSGVTKAGTYS